MKVGASFSISHAKWLAGEWGGPGTGPCWQDSFAQLISLKPACIRLGARWPEVEISPNVFDFSEYDHLFTMLNNTGIEIMVVLGVKNLRWPEVHIPDFYLKQDRPHRFQSIDWQRLGLHEQYQRYLDTSLAHFRNHPNVTFIQVENEPFEPTGPTANTIEPSVLKSEIHTIRMKCLKDIAVTMGAGFTEKSRVAERLRPRMLNQLLSMNPEMIGINVYPSSQWQQINGKVSTNNADEKHWHLLDTMYRTIVAAGVIPFVAELQAEPWEADPNHMNFIDPYGNSTFSIDDYKKVLERIPSFHFPLVLLWGVEFQTACFRQGNSTWLSATQDFIQKSNQ